MSDRRDKRGRVLRQGETQRPDGMYMFRYTDKTGKRRTVYSWRLTSTDKVPTGKKDTISLRDQEKEISKDLELEIDIDGAMITINEAFQQMMDIRQDLKPTTRKNYKQIYDAMIRDYIGKRILKAVRHSDLQKLYTKLAVEDKYSKSSILSAHNILLQLFNQALYDHKIRHNPATKAFGIISKSELCPPPKKRRALNKQEQAALIDHMYSEVGLQPYANLITVLLGTGLRIGECTGLRVCDCDFTAGHISVNHALSYKETEDQGYHFMVTTPKTPAGYRTVPMFDDVRNALLREIAKDQRRITEPYSVDGYSDFVFLTTKGTPVRASFIYEVLQRATETYNQKEKVTALAEKREPLYLPHISPHVLRHTFCTRMCECEANVKIVQEVMGHRRVTTTMDVYNEAQTDEISASFAAIDGKIKLA